ncbi:General stress protein 69 [Planctomycetes bacterium MalM25]|nr:General stress protein 69 [Planctomycetes bacterium MalM25]
MPEPIQRPLAETGLKVSPVALGCWPMAGVTTLGASHDSGVATVRAALDAGVSHFDTAYVYGPNGESDRILAEALAGRRDEVVLASKVGVHYETAAPGEKPTMATCGRPEVLKAECDELLRRLKTDRVDLLYLHSPDPDVPIAESAGALAELMAEGKTLCVGASNTQLEQTEAFHAACPLSALQLPYNMLQRDIEERTLPWARDHGVAVMVYWPLMKGLLAGAMGRDHTLDDKDSRRGYPMYQGDEWQRNHDFVEELRMVADDAGVTVAQLVVHWTLFRRGITSVLCGAKRPEQIEETAGAMRFQLNPEQQEAIAGAIVARGEAEGKRSFT